MSNKEEEEKGGEESENMEKYYAQTISKREEAE